MIRFAEALNYRCLRYIAQLLQGFQIPVGPDASGKTTFLDAVAFLAISSKVERSNGDT